MIDVDVRKKLIGAGGEFTLHARLRIKRGELAALFGESGAGKTTLLRILAGLTAPDEGVIRVGGETWLDTRRRINLPPQKRRIGFVFQDQALFPHLSVRGNLSYALPKHAERGFIDELLELTGLTTLQERRPNTLSGGQRQRVALARALARRPAVLMLDEPLSALDADTRRRLQDEILRLHKTLELSTLMVTHDIPEVFKLADRVFMVENGVVTRDDTPAAVFADRRCHGKLRLPAEVLGMESDGVLHTLTVLIGNQILSVVAGDEEIRNLRIGDQVMLLPKTFSPMMVAMN
jgi:molybdate transport system ATP-binding protein